MRGLVRVGSLRYVSILLSVSHDIISILLFLPIVAVLAIVLFLSFVASLYAYACLLDGFEETQTFPGFGLEFFFSSHSIPPGELALVENF